MQDYIVKQDDILGRIAQQFNISLQDLLRLNKESGNEIKDPDKIFVGQKIKVPGDSQPPKPTPTKASAPQPGEAAAPDIEKLVRSFLGLQLSLSILTLRLGQQNAIEDKLKEIQKQIMLFRNVPEDIKKSLRYKLKLNNKLKLSLFGEEGGTTVIEKYLQLRNKKGSEKAISNLLSQVNLNLKDIEDAAQDYTTVAPELVALGISPAYTKIKEHKLKGKNTMNKIFENYFQQNLKEEAEVSTSDPDAADIADIVVDEINAIFNELPDNSPLKSREVALAALAKIKAGLPAMIQGLNVS